MTELQGVRLLGRYFIIRLFVKNLRKIKSYFRVAGFEMKALENFEVTKNIHLPCSRLLQSTSMNNNLV